MNRFGSFERTVPPVKVGEELNVRIEAVGEKGDGICKKKGFVLFVPNTMEGDEVKIKITKVLHKVGFAEVVGKADAPVEEEGPRQADVVPPPTREPAPEDTEDFGEEDDSDDSEEESDEEPIDSDEEAEELEEEAPDFDEDSDDDSDDSEEEPSSEEEAASEESEEKKEE